MIALVMAAALAYGDSTDEDLEISHVGYLDVGLFDAWGDGVAYQRDRASIGALTPEDVSDALRGGAPAAWVFWGDPWANAVNSQGESADLGLGRNPIQRQDTLASGGRPTLLINRFNYGIHVDRDDQTYGLRARVNVDPRQGRLGSPGDLVSLDVAYLLWHPAADRDLTVYVGRIESGFATEYARRRASVRFGITPSLMARYTVGRQTGVRVRGTARRWFDYSASLTSGSTVDEGFGHFSDDIDTNGAPTATVRLGGHTDGGARFTGGLSGELGARDGQPDPASIGWMVGADAMLEVGQVVVRADGTIVTLPASGEAEDFLRAKGAALEGTWQCSNHLGAMLRVDWRDADLRVEDNLYVSNVLRFTAGVRVDLDYHSALKAEFLHLRELQGNELADDLFTTSYVFRY